LRQRDSTAKAYEYDMLHRIIRISALSMPLKIKKKSNQFLTIDHNYNVNVDFNKHWPFNSYTLERCPRDYD